MDIELLWGWLNCTVRSTGSENEFYADNFGKFCTPNICNYIFSLCSKLKTPEDVPFVTYTLLDRFICSELNLLFKSHYEVDPTHVKRSLSRKKKELILHIYSVLQLTTKVVDRRKILKASALEKILRKISLPSDIKEIVNSEVYVLRALQDDLCCFNLLTPSEFLFYVHKITSQHVNSDSLIDVLYIASANLSQLLEDVRTIYPRKMQPHESLRIVSAAAVICASLIASNSVSKLARLCASILKCSTDEILGVTHCLLCLF